MKIIWWFALRPDHWLHAAHFKLGKIRGRHDTESARAEATEWARKRVVTVGEALRAVGLLEADQQGLPPKLPEREVEEGLRKISTIAVQMGGPGDLELIYAAAVLSGASRAVESGVAYGWSSLAILAALDLTSHGRLISVDMPYPAMGNEAWVGAAIPDRLRNRWRLIRKPDRNGLKEAIRGFGNEIDFAHYDSDKSYRGRMFGYALMWKALVPGGVFISDDIQDNWAYRDFISTKNVDFSVTESSGKFVAVAIKP